MEFTFSTRYNAKTMAIMAKALRKTVRKKHSRRSHILGWAVMVFAAVLLVSKEFVLDFRTAVTLMAVAAILITLLFEDSINGYLAQKKLLPGTERSHTVFNETSFVSTTDIGQTQWNYDKILAVAETADFFVFIFSASHGQLYDKHSLQGGTAEDFRGFIENMTGKQIVCMK